LQPLLHVSGRYSAAHHYITVILPLAWHPKNRNALIVCDLQLDPQVLLELDAEALRQRLYTRREDLLEGELPVPLKLLHVNRCPVLAPLNVLRDSEQQRLQLDLSACQQRANILRDSQGQWLDKLQAIYVEEGFAPNEDPEQQLYSGFFDERDRRLCEQVRKAEPEDLARAIWPFDDARLPELLFRYRARNFPNTLTVEEVARWQLFCKQRLTDPQFGAPNTLDAFEQALAQAMLEATEPQQALLGQWQAYAQQLASRLML
jgi:exodeoxyribonuclease-1